MKPVLPKIFVLLAVSVSAILLLNRRIVSSSSSHGSFEDPDSSSSPLLVFLILNTIVLTVLLGSHKPNCHGADLPHPSDKVAENDDRENRDEGDIDVKEYSGSGRSDGYDGDDDMSGSDDEISWEDGDCTNSLEKRIEEFITKVDEPWCVERFKENNHKESVT